MTDPPNLQTLLNPRSIAVIGDTSNEMHIELPALREHAEDIPLIANHLLEKHCAKLNKPLKKLSPELLELFLKRPGSET